MTDISRWLGSGDPPLLDSLLDLPETLGYTKDHAIQHMDSSWLDDEMFIDGCSLLDECNSSNPLGSNESAIQTQSELVSSNVLQETTFARFESLPEVFVGESHDSSLHGAGRQATADSDVDQTTTNEQRKQNPGSPTFPSPQPRKKNNVTFSRSSKRRAKLSPDAKKVLEDFFKRNIYPEPNDIARLVEQTGAEKQQIKTWFRNQRTRKLNVDMGGGPQEAPESSCRPAEQTFERVLADIPRIDPKSLMEKYLGIPLDQDHRMPTTATLVAEREENETATGSESSWSSYASQNSWSSRRGRRKVVKHRNTGQYNPIPEPYKFRCTFCGEGLKDRYQWRRHEETKHAPRTGWICKDRACSNKPIEGLIFFREDLFTQHRVKHAPHGQPLAKFEVISANPIPEAHPTLQCGFCGERLPDWANRVTHIAAHFEQGANLSSWWLKRAEFIPELKNPSCLWSEDDFKAVLPHSVFCIHCGRLYSSPEDAKTRHHECMLWSCGQFQGVLAAYKKSMVSGVPLWSCIYCGEMIFEASPDHSERLNHLIMEHTYRSCTPQSFLESSHFQNHLMSHHKALLGRAARLESACRLTRKPRFRSATNMFGIGPALIYYSLPLDEYCYAGVNILGRSYHGDLRFTTALVCFDLRVPHNIISLEALDLLRLQLDIQIEQSDGPYVDTPADHVGHVVIRWSGAWGVQLRSGVRLPAPGAHKTKVFVVDCGLERKLTFGCAVLEGVKMVQRCPPPV